MPKAAPPEADLLTKLRSGDETTFTQLVDAWSPGMLRVAATFTTQDTAAEVVQDTWLAVIEGIDRFEGRSTLKTWTYRILINTAKRRGTKETRTWKATLHFQGPDDPYPGHWAQDPPPWPTPEQHTLTTEIRERLAEAIHGLPERQRTVLILRDVEGYDSTEVCSILDLTPANQRVLLHRARASVRAALADYYTPEVLP